jgi:hypothetical protein
MRNRNIAFAVAVALVLLASSLAGVGAGPSLGEVPDLTATVSPAVEPVAYLPLIEKQDAPTNTPTTTVPPLPEPSATPTTTALPSSTPGLPPPSFNNCQQDPNPGAAPNYPIAIVDINKQAETVTLQNVTTGDTIDLTGWTMCSIRGNQIHPISGAMTPGSVVLFNGPGGIWNNFESDPGALYNPSGQLVSYWPD